MNRRERERERGIGWSFILSCLFLSVFFVRLGCGVLYIGFGGG